MAGFQVANFSFGKNIKDDERQRAIASMNAATARRGQDMQAAQADANRAENARQFDAQMAEREAQREEGARQFDERMGAEQDRLSEGARQFDETQAQKKLAYADSRSDIERAQSWDDAIKMQQMEKEAQEMENRRLAFDERNAKLDSYLRIKDEEDAQAARRNALMESSYGNMAVLAQLQNGTVTKKQVDAFNEELLEGGMIDKGREYNYIGTIDQTTGQPFADGRLHFIRYALDGNGQVQMDQKTGRPLVEIDNPLNTDIRNAMLSSYFGDVKEFMGSGRGGGMSPERMQLENDRINQRRIEEDGRNARAGLKNDAANARLAASVAKNMNDIRRGLRLNDEQAASFQTSLTRILSDAFGGGGGGGEEGNEQAASGGGKAAIPAAESASGKARQIGSPSEMNGSSATESDDFRTDKNGVKWMIVRDKNGKPIGKKRVQ